MNIQTNMVGFSLFNRSCGDESASTTAIPLPQEILIQNQQKRDREHLKLLSILHFVVAGLALLGIGFLFVHYFFMHTFFSNPEMWKNHGNATPPPKAFLDAFIWMDAFFAAIFVLASVLNLLSAVFLLQRRHRMFSIVVAGLDCFQIPFGTALGVFTIIVLSRKLSVHCIPVLSRADMQVCGALDGCHQGKPISFG